MADEETPETPETPDADAQGPAPSAEGAAEQQPVALAVGRSGYVGLHH